MKLGLERLIPGEVFQDFGYSRYIYGLPVELGLYKFFPSSPEHKGNYRYAIDILVPDPRVEETLVYAPASGFIQYVCIEHYNWGCSPEDAGSLNFVNVDVGGEFYELCHIEPVNGVSLFPGREIRKGEVIARVGLNGRITTTNGNPDSHIHMMVGKWMDKEVFTSLRIRWERNVEFISAY